MNHPVDFGVYSRMTDTLESTGALLVPPVEAEPQGSGRAPVALIAAIVVGALVVATGGLWLLLRSPGPAASDDLLVRDESGAVSLLDTETGATVFEVPNAVVAPDRSAILTTEHTVGGTVIESRDPSTGAVTGTTTLLGELEIRTISPQGDTVALMAPRPEGLGLYEPEPRRETEVTIAFLTDERPAVRYSLDGNFEPEVFSYEADVLYLLQFEPAEAPDLYYVRELEVATGLVDAVHSPQVDLQPEMRGVARAQAVAPDGRRVYTLYSLPADADPIHDPGAAADDSERWAFVHVLDLENGYDFCIFLPVPMGTVNEANLGIGVSPDGRILYVVDPSHALAARVDTESLEITDVYEVPEILDWTQRPQVAVDDEGALFVGLGPDVREFGPSETADGETVLAAWGGYSFTAPASGVSLTSDNRYLRLVADGKVIVIDRAYGEETAVLSAPSGAGDYEILGPPSGNVTRIPLECAC